MALATICPHCHTRFRVASDQLKLRGGIVRCGACNEVFDGNAALVDAAARQAAEPAPAEAPPPPPEQPDAPAESASDAFDAEVASIDAAEVAETESEPEYVLDFDTTLMPLPNEEPATEPELPAPAAFEPRRGDEAEPEPVIDEEIVALPPPDEDEVDEAPGEAPPQPPVYDAGPDSLAPFLTRASAAAEPWVAPAPVAAVSKPARRNAARRQQAAAKPAPPAAPDPFDADTVPASDEPEFVRRVRLKEQTGRTRRLVLGAACALLLVLLAVQAMSTFRNVLAARYPAAKPALAATCAVFGCKVELPAQIDTLSVETGELQSLGANAFSYSTLLRNPGTLAQAWPHIELALTDANDKPLVRRVFTPAQYLPPGVAVAKGIGPRTEQPVKLYFELNQVKASGYHIAIFYP